jgi:uncharacterized protein (TIGR03435 family)
MSGNCHPARDFRKAPHSLQTDGPDIFTALREQLGLRLEKGKGPVDYLVIEHVEKPSAN